MRGQAVAVCAVGVAGYGRVVWGELDLVKSSETLQGAHHSFLAANKPGFRHLELSCLQSCYIAQGDLVARISSEKMALR